MAVEMKARKLIHGGVIARVIAERSLGDEGFLRVHESLEDEIRVRRHFEAHRLAWDGGHGAPSEKAREHPFIDAVRKRRRGGVGERRIAPERDGDVQSTKAKLFGATKMAGPRLVHLPVHRRGAAIKLLHSVASHVARACVRIPRDDLGQRDERASVVRPGGQNRQRVEVDLVAHLNDVLATTLRRHPGGHMSQIGQLARKLDEGAAAGRSSRVHEVRERSRVIFEIRHAQRERHAGARAEGIDEQRKTGSRDVFEQESRAPSLHCAVGDGGHLQAGVRSPANAHELRALLQRANERVHAVPRHPQPPPSFKII